VIGSLIPSYFKAIDFIVDCKHLTKGQFSNLKKLTNKLFCYKTSVEKKLCKPHTNSTGNLLYHFIFRCHEYKLYEYRLAMLWNGNSTIKIEKFLKDEIFLPSKLKVENFKKKIDLLIHGELVRKLEDIINNNITILEKNITNLEQQESSKDDKLCNDKELETRKRKNSQGNIIPNKKCKQHQELPNSNIIKATNLSSVSSSNRGLTL